MRRAVSLALIGVVAVVALPAVADAGAADRQYRVARRLAAEGSPGAKAAMRKVLRLDPDGPHADDAMVEIARLIGAAASPEALGRLGDRDAAEVEALLEGVLTRFTGSDRAAEARYLRALMRLEPNSRYDTSRARTELLEVATALPQSPWNGAARYALGWLHEQQGRDQRARATYQRLIVDERLKSPGSAAARVGLARLLVRESLFGEAAGWLQEAIDSGLDEPSRAAALRELAMRQVLGRAAASPEGGRRYAIPLRGVVGFAAGPDGGAFIASRREDRVVRFDATGRAVGEWIVAQPQALAVGVNGEAVVAAEDGLIRLEDGGASEQIASLQGVGTIDSIAIDGLGGVWLLDRRGSVTRVDPGASSPRPFWEDRSLRLQSLVWDGRRLVAVEPRGRRLLAILADGSLRTILEGGLVRPVSTSADPSGRLAVLDDRAGFVFFIAANGRPGEAFAFAVAGLEFPSAAALGPDGTLHLLDVENGIWFRAR